MKKISKMLFVFLMLASGRLALAIPVFTPTPVPVPTATPVPDPASPKAEPMLAPNPASKGDVVQVYVPAGKNTSSVSITVFDTAGNRVAKILGGAWNTAGVASGIYMLNMEITYTDGSKETKVKKVVVK